jgi:hypothetical protein
MGLPLVRILPTKQRNRSKFRWQEPWVTHDLMARIAGWQNSAWKLGGAVGILCP